MGPIYKRVSVASLLCALSAATASTQIDQSVVASPATIQTDTVKRASNGAWDTFATDITVRVSITATATTKPITLPADHFTLERTTAGGPWKTIITRKGPSAIRLSSLHGPIDVPDPFAAARLEDDGDGSNPRLYDGAGQLVKLPEQAAVQLFGTALNRLSSVGDTPSPLSDPTSAAWLDNFIATPAHQAARQQTVAALGQPASTVRGLSQFLNATGDTVQEVLIDPLLAVPIEMNIVRSGTLVTHVTFSYVQASDGTAITTSSRAEILISDVTGQRAIVEREYANTRLEQRR